MTKSHNALARWRRLQRALLTIAGCYSLAPIPLTAQDTSVQQTPDSAARPGPTAIPAGEIAAQAVDLAQALASVRDGLRRDTILTLLDTSLASVELRIAARREALADSALAQASLDELEDRERRWQEFERRLLDWQARLVRAGTLIDSLDTALEARRTRWTLTRNSARAESLPPELRERVRLALADIDSVEQRLQAPRARALAIQDRVGAALVTTREALRILRDASDAARRQLFRRDSPPLWRAFGAPADTAVAVEPTSVLGNRIDTATAYFETHPDRTILHILLLIVIAGSLLGLRSRFRSWIAAGHGASAMAVLFDHPIASGLLVALGAIRLIHPDAPQAVFQLAWTTALIPLLLLMPAIVTRESRRAGYLVVALVAIDLLLDVFVIASLWRRLATLALAAIALLTFAVLLRSRDLLEHARRSGWWRAARAGVYVAIGLVSLSILVNVVGYVGLAQLLASATVRSAFGALGATIIAAVVFSLVAVMFDAGLTRSHIVRTQRDGLLARTGWIIRAGAVAMWLVIALRQFRLFDPATALSATILGAKLEIGTWTLSLGGILVFLLSLVVTVLLARAVHTVLRREILTRMTLPRGVPDTISRLAYYAVLVLGFLFAVGAAGLNLSQLTIILGALGVGIGFGLQNIVNNFISGLILLFERPIQIGDVVELETLMGTVKDIGIRASVIRTFSGAEVIVPNGDLIAGRLINWTLSDQKRRVEIPVGVAYGSDPQRVIHILGEVAQRHPDTIHDPAPATHFVGFGDSSLDFMIWAWTGRIDRWWQMRTEILTEAYAALGDAGIEIPFPQRDLHLKTVGGAAARALTPDRSGGEAT